MESGEDVGKTGNDSASMSSATATPVSSQGSALLKQKSRSCSKDVSPRSGTPKDSSSRRDRHSNSKSSRRRHRSRSSSDDRRGRYKRRRRTRSPAVVLVRRNPRGSEGDDRRRRRSYRQSYRERNGRRRRESRSRSTSRRRKSGSRSTSKRRGSGRRSRSRSHSQHEDKYRSSKRRGSRSRSPPKSKSKTNPQKSTSNSSISSTEQIQKHTENIRLNRSTASDDNSTPGSDLTSEDRSKRFNTRIIFITNLSPEVTKNQLEILFGFCGTVRDIHLYPVAPSTSTLESTSAKTCAFIKFVRPDSTNVAVHLIGEPFLGRPLLVFPCVELDDIPDPVKAAKLLSTGLDKVINLIKGESINQFLNDSSDTIMAKPKTSTSSETAPPAAAAGKSSSASDISVLLSWPNDWLSWFWKDIK